MLIDESTFYRPQEEEGEDTRPPLTLAELRDGIEGDYRRDTCDC